MFSMMFVELLGDQTFNFWKKKEMTKNKDESKQTKLTNKQTNKPKVGLPVSKNHLTKFRLTFYTFKVASFLRASFTGNGLYMVAT